MKILDIFSRKNKKDYEVVKSRSNLPVFVLELPPEIKSTKGKNETD
jgi:hypothetical protein